MTMFAPVGPLSVPCLRLAHLVASTDEWRTMCGGVSAEEALERIHWPTADDADDADDPDLPAARRPRAIVDPGDEWRLDLEAIGTRLPGGQLYLSIEVPLFELGREWPAGAWPAGAWPEGAWPEFEIGRKDQLLHLLNRLGALAQQIGTLRGRTPEADEISLSGMSHLNVTALSLTVPPHIVDPVEHNGQLYGAAMFSVRWS